MILLTPVSTARFCAGNLTYGRYAARASSGLAVFDCPVMNASAVLAWDTGLPSLLTLRKDGLPECRAGGDHLCHNSGKTD